MRAILQQCLTPAATGQKVKNPVLFRKSSFSGSEFDFLDPGFV